MMGRMRIVEGSNGDVLVIERVNDDLIAVGCDYCGVDTLFTCDQAKILIAELAMALNEGQDDGPQ